MTRNPIIAVSLGSGRDGWISVDLASLRFTLEVENGKTTTELLTLAELRRRFPNVSNIVAEVLASAVRVSPTPTA